jgi:hypothetical protein
MPQPGPPPHKRTPPHTPPTGKKWVFLLAFASSAVAQSIVSTLAGIAGTIGSADGPAASSTFRLPEGVACLGWGSLLGGAPSMRLGGGR